MTQFWSRWLMVAAVIVLLFGLALVLAAGPMQRVFEALYFTPRTGADLQGSAASYAAFLQGVLGAVMVGWAVALLSIIRGPFRRGEAAAWNMLAASIAVWVFADTAFSLWTGYWQNALLNAVVFAAFAIPLAATYRRSHPEPGAESPRAARSAAPH